MRPYNWNRSCYSRIHAYIKYSNRKKRKEFVWRKYTTKDILFRSCRSMAWFDIEKNMYVRRIASRINVSSPGSQNEFFSRTCNLTLSYEIRSIFFLTFFSIIFHEVQINRLYYYYYRYYHCYLYY